MNAFRKQLVPGALVLAAALGVLPACAQQKAAAAGSNQVLAVVDGKPITEADIRAKNADQFKALDREYQQNVHQLLENSLDQAVQDFLRACQLPKKAEEVQLPEDRLVPFESVAKNPITHVIAFDSGYQEVPAFNDDPYAQLFFEKSLPKPARSPRCARS